MPACRGSCVAGPFLRDITPAVFPAMTTCTIRDLSAADLAGKRALVRVDFNVPLDDAGQITDDARITETLPTLKSLLAGGARVVLMAM